MRGRTLTIALAVSILLNVFLVGGAIGGALWWRGAGAQVGAGSIRIAGSELSAQQRHAFRTALKDERRQMRATIADGRAARRDAAVLLRAPVLDQAALGAALARIRADDLAIRARLEARAVAFTASLPAHERAKLAAGLERRAEPKRK